ncbi:hypothetical protein L873DRAFT_1100327 [Choiromyces venosus 120613-1]|uniref:Uncharacterized protein n=1 Tax=Choiromyces venosus 120613-1 TaxID=1336337 RepID=A0A3N4JHB0_9PEZI|nr:hypothetical protein L873DRAFT_1100327 [Choiromyces venosus 120613-1]
MKRDRKIGGEIQDDQRWIIPKGELSEISQQASEYDDILDGYHKMRVSFVCWYHKKKKKGAESRQRRKTRSSNRPLYYDTIYHFLAIHLFAFITHRSPPHCTHTIPVSYRRRPVKLSFFDKKSSTTSKKKKYWTREKKTFTQFNVLNLTACCVSLGISYLIFVPSCF